MAGPPTADLLEERIQDARRQRERVRNVAGLLLLLVAALAVVEMLMRQEFSSLALVVPILVVGGILETVARQREADLAAIRSELLGAAA